MKMSESFKSLVVAASLYMCVRVYAELSISVSNVNEGSGKIVVSLKLKNTFKEQITSARASVFLLNDEGKVVGQSTKWIIGGSKEAPPLRPDASTTYKFVIRTDKPFTKTKVSVGRLILEGGKVVDPRKNVLIQQ